MYNDELFHNISMEAYLALDPSSYPLPNSGNISKVLSADRVEQMTRTYNDIEVVTHLLSERDRDLELAARIGQSLLQRNNLLQERNEAVEEQLNQAIDQVHQLQHELAKKDELLRMVASASEESESDSSCSTPHPLLQRAPGGGASTAAAATATALGQLEALQGKLEELEEENQALRSEASHLKTETFCYEEKEQRLVNDCVKELRDSRWCPLADELSQKGRRCCGTRRRVAQLLSQIVEAAAPRQGAGPGEGGADRSTCSFEGCPGHSVTAELNELTERNAECLGMLHESQEEVKDLRSKSNPTGGLRRHLSYGLYPMDSLAAEIEGTMRKELSVDEETIFQDQRTSQRRVFQTVRSVNTLTARAAASSSSPIPGSGLSPLVMTAQPFQSAQGYGFEPHQQGELLPSLPLDGRSLAGCTAPRSPGAAAPATTLSDAIRRLSCGATFLCERKFFQAEQRSGDREDLRGRGGASGAALEEARAGPSGRCSPAARPGPIVLLKPCRSCRTASARRSKSFLPKRFLQIVSHEGGTTQEEEERRRGAAAARAEEKRAPRSGGKPSRRTNEEEEGRREEGRKHSVELPREQPRRATTAPKVRHEGGARAVLASAGAPAVLSSVQHPGKCQSSTYSTYTVTTCRILHPNDITQVTSSSQPMWSVAPPDPPSSLRTRPSTPVTPCRLILGGSSCFPPRRPPAPPPTGAGLAKLVLDRGISASARPAPSPPPRRRPAPPLPQGPAGGPPPPGGPPGAGDQRPALALDNFLASRPAELFLQDVYGLNLGRAPPHPDLPSPRPDAPPPKGSGGGGGGGGPPDPVSVGLVERLCRLGFGRVLQGPADPPPTPSSFVGQQRRGRLSSFTQPPSSGAGKH
ncbi:unnamed protein product [Boreogadus saida]